MKVFAVALLAAAVVQSIGSISTFQETGLALGILNMVAPLASAVGVIGMFLGQRWTIYVFGLAVIVGIAAVVLTGEITPTALGVIGAQIVFLVQLWRTRA